MGLLDRLRGLVGAKVVDPQPHAAHQADGIRPEPALASPPHAPLVRSLLHAGAPADLVQLVDDHHEWLVATLPASWENAGYHQHLALEEAMAARLKTADDGQLRAAASLSLARVRNTTDSLYQNLAYSALTRLARRKMGWTGTQVAWLLSCTTDVALFGRRAPLLYPTEIAGLAVGAAERLSDSQDVAACAAGLDQLLARLETSTAAGAKMAGRINALLGRSGGKHASKLADSVLPVGDRYGALVRTALAAAHPAELVVTTVTHLGGYSGSVVPGKGWRARAEQLLAAQPGASDVAVTMLQTLLDHDDHPRERAYGQHVFIEPFFVDQGTAQLLRAAVWMVALAPNVAERVPLLGAVAVHCGLGYGGTGSSSRLSPVTTSVLAALAEVATTTSDPSEVVGQLARVRTKVSNKPIRKAADAALEQAAAAAGMTSGELLERAVPDFGLDADGAAEVPVGIHTALLALEGGGAGAKLGVRWRTPAGKVLAGVPAVVKAEHAELLAELRSRAKEAKTAVSVQRVRVEDLLATTRTWSGASWRAHYVEHPVVGLTARSLLWQVRTVPVVQAAAGSTDVEAAGWSSGLPEKVADAWVLRGHDGAAVEVDAEAELRLWHPLQQPLAEVQAWRAHLSDRGVRQPFKQAFREIYLLTPAEVGTGTYSNRFAGHILRYPQAGALMRARGWSGAHLGYWDGGQDGQATKELEGGWRATFYYETVENDADHYGQVSLCSSDQVRFERHDGPREGGGWNPRPLTEVPALLLSETMRDVDLFVGVTSVAADPEWADRGDDRVQAYWQRESFGDLGESAQMRRQALERLLPRTKLAGRAELVGRFLVVHGHLRDYKIHLGSGNILMSPADTYLCIVAARTGAEQKRVYLPFEEDGGKLAIILSKAFMLAEDTSVTDTSITRQLRLGL